MRTATLPPYRVRPVDHPSFAAFDLARIAKGLRQLYRLIPEERGRCDRHDGGFISLVLEVAAKGNTKVSTSVAGEPLPDAKEFASYFLEREPGYSTTKAGVSALLFETWLAERGGELYGMFLETVLETNTEYLAIFTGLLQDNDLEQIRNRVADFATFEIAVRAGDRDYEHGLISDVTMLRCKAAGGKLDVDREKAAMGLPPNDGPPNADTSNLQRPNMESLLPRSREDYARVVDEGGLSSNAVLTVFGTNPFSDSILEGSTFSIHDANGTRWVSEDGSRWLPDLASFSVTDVVPLTLNRVKPEAPELREWAAPSAPTLTPQLFHEDASGAIRSRFGAWAVLEAPVEGGRSQTVVAVGARAWTVRRSLAEVRANVDRIAGIYGDLPDEFDLMVEAFLDEYGDDVGVEVSNPQTLVALFEGLTETIVGRDGRVHGNCVERLDELQAVKSKNPDQYHQQVGQCPDGYHFDARNRRCVPTGKHPTLVRAGATNPPAQKATQAAPGRLQKALGKAWHAVTEPMHAAAHLAKSPEARKELRGKILTAVKKEGRETKALMGTLGKLISRKPISPEERNAAISQTVDLVKTAMIGYMVQHLFAGGVVKALATLASPADEVVGVVLDKPLRKITAKVFGQAHGILPTAFYEASLSPEDVLGQLIDQILDELSKTEVSDEEIEAALASKGVTPEKIAKAGEKVSEAFPPNFGKKKGDEKNGGDEENAKDGDPNAPPFQPPPPPEPATPTDHMDDPPFYRDDLQSYYDMQITQLLSSAQALQRTRDQFKVRGLIVTPAGEVRAPGVLDRPETNAPPPPPPPRVAAPPKFPDVPPDGGPGNLAPEEPAPEEPADKTSTSSSKTKVSVTAGEALTSADLSALDEWLGLGGPGGSQPCPLLRPWARLSGRPEAAVGVAWEKATAGHTGVLEAAWWAPRAAAVRAAVLAESVPPGAQLSLPTVEDAFLYWLVYEDGDLSEFEEWVGRFCPHLEDALDVWQPSDAPLEEGRLQRVADARPKSVRQETRRPRFAKRTISEEQHERHDKWRRLVNMRAPAMRRFLTSESFREALKGPRSKTQDLRLALQAARPTLLMKVTPVEEWTNEMWNWCGRQTRLISRLRGNGQGLIEGGRLTRKYVTLKAWGHDPGTPGSITDAELVWLQEGDGTSRANRTIDALAGVSPHRILSLDEKVDTPDFAVLKKHRQALDQVERETVMSRGAVWHHGPDGSESPAVWKARLGEKTWFVTNTHRAYNVAATLEGAITRYHKFIKSTA